MLCDVNYNFELCESTKVYAHIYCFARKVSFGIIHTIWQNKKKRFSLFVVLVHLKKIKQKKMKKKEICCNESLEWKLNKNKSFNLIFVFLSKIQRALLSFLFFYSVIFQSIVSKYQFFRLTVWFINKNILFHSFFLNF